MENKVQKQYLSEVRKFLNCPSRDRKKILKDLKKSTDNYMAEHPNAAREELEEFFGTPEMITRSYYGSLETDNLGKKFRVRRLVGIGCVVAFVVIVIFCVEGMRRAEQRGGGYIIETVEEIESIEDEEIQNQGK